MKNYKEYRDGELVPYYADNKGYVYIHPQDKMFVFKNKEGVLIKDTVINDNWWRNSWYFKKVYSNRGVYD